MFENGYQLEYIQMFTDKHGKSIQDIWKQIFVTGQGQLVL